VGRTLTEAGGQVRSLSRSLVEGAISHGPRLAAIALTIAGCSISAQSPDRHLLQSDEQRINSFGSCQTFFALTLLRARSLELMAYPVSTQGFKKWWSDSCSSRRGTLQASLQLRVR